jgi:predicted AAA+ superfamily ATPase
VISQILAIHKRLLQATESVHHRYIFDEFNINNRLTGLIGARGTGKTTLLLQFIKEKVENPNEALYVSLDNIHFSSNPLFNFVNEMIETEGIRTFFFDEVHKYQGWNQELKNIYDSFPEVTVVFSGSSSIDLVEGSYDLSRRAVLFRLTGMSFREYLKFTNIADLPVINLQTILENKDELEAKLASIPKLRGHFKDYLAHGYYPFFLESVETYHQKLLRVIEKTVYEDISNYYKLKTEKLPFFKKILSYMATIPPCELNRNNIAKHIGLDHKTIQHYLQILQQTGLAELVTSQQSGNQLLKTTEKIYLDNPNIYQTIATEIGHDYQVGTVRELFFIKMLKNSGYSVHYSKTGDFIVDDVIFEVGGKSKTRKQLKQVIQKAYLVKDDILYGGKNEIPLHLLGFLY